MGEAIVRLILTDEDLRNLHDRATNDYPESKTLRERVLEALNITDIKLFNKRMVTFLQKKKLDLTKT